jgi:hypothetical protein
MWLGSVDRSPNRQPVEGFVLNAQVKASVIAEYQVV